MKDLQQEISSFLAVWPVSSHVCRTIFIELMEFILAQEGTRLKFHTRPGVTYSLWAMHHKQIRPLYAMVDVIEDEPRWLSVCFYSQMVTDPVGRGNIVPGGLLGEDGLCFDAEKITGEQLNYLKERISEAYATAIDG